MNAPASAPSRVRLSADVGGTFTDIAAFNEATGELRLGKTPTTPTRLVDGIDTGVDAIAQALAAERMTRRFFLVAMGFVDNGIDFFLSERRLTP